jgi:hypothetical protein
MTTGRSVLPVRLRLSRFRTAHLTSPNYLPIVLVSRPSRWGNPWKPERCCLSRKSYVWLVATYRFDSERDAYSKAVELFRAGLLSGALNVTVEQVRKALAGKNLACWCRLDQPCHADVLLCVARGVYS